MEENRILDSMFNEMALNTLNTHADLFMSQSLNLSSISNVSFSVFMDLNISPPPTHTLDTISTKCHLLSAILSP